MKPLAVVLVAQLVVIMGAIGFLAGRAGHAPPPSRAVAAAADDERRASRPKPAPPPEVHAPAAKLGERAEPAEPPAEAKPPERKNESEWQAYGEKTAGEQAPEPSKAEPSFEDVVSGLVAGNARFVEGASRQRDVVALRESLAAGERASTVVITCSDSRVVPELVFDQPLGTFDVLRVPGAQVDDGLAKAVDEAIERLHARAVLVLGHAGCSHVDKALSRAGGARSARPATLTAALGGLQTLEGAAREAAVASAAITFSAQQLARRSKRLGHGDEVTLLRVLYAPATGAVRWLDAEEPVTAAPAPRAGRR
jgi:carbonic anhydrase